MFSIIVGAGLFGFAGMLLGVPVFVVLYTGLTGMVNRKLKRSGLPTDGDYYKGLDYISSETGEAVRKEENRRRTGKKKSLFKKRAGSGKAASERVKTGAKNKTNGDEKSSGDESNVSEGKS